MLDEVSLQPADNGSACQRWRLDEIGCNIYTISSAAPCDGSGGGRYLAASRRSRAVTMARFSLTSEQDRLWRLSLPAQ